MDVITQAGITIGDQKEREVDRKREGERER
jgi:hypothetical protein